MKVSVHCHPAMRTHLRWKPCSSSLSSRLCSRSKPRTHTTVSDDSVLILASDFLEHPPCHAPINRHKATTISQKGSTKWFTNRDSLLAHINSLPKWAGPTRGAPHHPCSLLNFSLLFFLFWFEIKTYLFFGQKELFNHILIMFLIQILMSHTWQKQARKTQDRSSLFGRNREGVNLVCEEGPLFSRKAAGCTPQRLNSSILLLFIF